MQVDGFFCFGGDGGWGAGWVYFYESGNDAGFCDEGMELLDEFSGLAVVEDFSACSKFEAVVPGGVVAGRDVGEGCDGGVFGASAHGFGGCGDAGVEGCEFLVFQGGDEGPGDGRAGGAGICGYQYVPGGGGGGDVCGAIWPRRVPWRLRGGGLPAIVWNRRLCASLRWRGCSC